MSKILIGREIIETAAPVGIRPSRPEPEPRKAFDIVDTSDAGLVTIAPTGAGKGVTQIIPNALIYPGSMVIIDIKGEIAAVTARKRREMGHDVYIVDPFGRADTDYIDPFGLIQRQHPSAVDDCRMLAGMMNVRSHSNDPFWDDRARDLVTGSLLFVAEHVPEHLRQLPLIQRIWTSSIEELSTALSLMQASPLHDGILGRFAHQFTDAPDKTRSSIHSTIHNHVEFLASPIGQRGLGVGARGRKVDLERIKAGKPTTVYLTVPPHYLTSHAALLRLWVGTLLTAVQRRKVRPAIPDLFVVDEAAQLGRMEQILMASSLLRGYGLRVWTFWQSVGQMERLYGPASREFIDNAGTLSVFGVANGTSATAAAALTGWQGDLLGIKRSRQIIAQAGKAPRLAGRVNYLRDPRFRGMFDPNPFHATNDREKEESR